MGVRFDGGSWASASGDGYYITRGDGELGWVRMY